MIVGAALLVASGIAAAVVLVWLYGAPVRRARFSKQPRWVQVSALAAVLVILLALFINRMLD
jgi:hypothetical protein